jgi:hypothetical protein
MHGTKKSAGNGRILLCFAIRFKSVARSVLNKSDQSDVVMQDIAPALRSIQI